MKLMQWLRRIRDTLTGKPTTDRPSAQKTSTSELYVYITVRGKKFHYDPCCPSILDAFNRGDAIKIGLSKARASGRKACNKCCWSYLHE